jgi:uncharacterized RDD family membrane protein YckC
MDNHSNPYQALPPSTLPPEEDLSFLLPVEKCPIPGFVSAGRKRRLLNLIIDSACIALIQSLIVFFPLQQPPLTPAQTLLGFIKAMPLLIPTVLRYGIIFTPLLYYILLEMLSGRTLGKLVTGTRVINEQGRRPTFGQTLLRTLIRFFPCEAFTFLGDTRGFHDSVGTWVVLNKPQSAKIDTTPQ